MNNLKSVAGVEAKAREGFDRHFHKIAASMSYDQWRLAFAVGFRYGREDATKDWADHMARMVEASK
jgi:hypothetical protein